MRTRPPDLDDRQLIAAVQRGWGVSSEAVDYVPVGGGSHHWRPTDMPLWLTLDDLDEKPFLGSTRGAVFDALRCALEVASALADHGLEFVVAPLRALDGAILELLDERYALAVYPYLAGTTFAWGRPLPSVHREAQLQILIRLHQAAPVVAATARAARIELAGRDTLERALCESSQPWPGGPFGEPARALVVQHAEYINDLLQRFDALLAEVRQRAGPLVLTHGEPHPLNLMLHGSSLRLLDWDTVGLAPPERDLWWLADKALDQYADATGHHVDPDAQDLYRLRWQLDDFIYSVRRLRAPHTRTEDIERTWAFLSRTLRNTE